MQKIPGAATASAGMFPSERSRIWHTVPVSPRSLPTGIPDPCGLCTSPESL